MGKYCCFFCPESDYSERELTDVCPKCGRPFNFPLENLPDQIDRYSIESSLGRGFYASTYVAKGPLGRPQVLKVTPSHFYSFEPFHRSPFDQECQAHADLADNADHIVGIQDMIPNVNVEFGGKKNSLPCNVMVLDYVDGSLLKKYLAGNIHPSVQEICQITVDLLMIIHQLQTNNVNHNDLHSENLIVKKLSIPERRVDAICDSIKVMAIDLGSINEASKSTDARSGDLTFVTKHIGELLRQLLTDPGNLDDKDYRIALRLQDLIYSISSRPENLRLGTPDLIKKIKDAYSSAARPFRPWSTPLTMNSLSDHMNAQTLESWDVPRLLVDPDNRWIPRLTGGGPQIITGMRGCGKTMLLRALDIHARINYRDGESWESTAERIRSEGYVGLFASAQRLLDLKQDALRGINSRVTRLFANYALAAVRALLHAKDLDRSLIELNAHSELGSAAADYLGEADELRKVLSLDELERQLTKILVRTNTDHSAHLVTASPSEAFPHLAETLRKCSNLFSSSRILFLLDDVSTRHLDVDRIGELISTLLFQHPTCAFKFTSEWQTIELGLKSPGREHPVRVGRDIDVFDLGADVHEQIKGGKNVGGLKGSEFVASILEKRSTLTPYHPKGIKPIEILGDATLEEIAKEICGSSSTSSKRKNAYRGLTCLSKMCVGDLGDVIKIYDEIVRRCNHEKGLPVSAATQSECFRSLSSARLYDLNRREGHFKNHALAFAEASHELMVRSYKKAKSANNDKKRLRIYTSIYVRVTTQDNKRAEEQIKLLRDLIDASVFVFTGGSARSKTKDSNPMRQFILSYRKIYGLPNYIGLADRDRFELSGDGLAEWLRNPSKEILIRNQTEENTALYISDDEKLEDSPPSEKETKQPELFGVRPSTESTTPNDGSQLCTITASLNIRIEKLAIEEISNLSLGSIVTSLGFEDRSLEANRQIASILNPSNVLAIKYPLLGYSNEIRKIWDNAGKKIKEIESDKHNGLGKLQGKTLIDISGLTKPFIFKSIYGELIEKGEVFISYASAEKYYPLQEDLRELLDEQTGDGNTFLEGLANILVGEEGPYSRINLLSGKEADPSRGRALLAFAPTKHQRLFKLLDDRDFDWLELIAPNSDSPRDKASNLAAEFIAKNQPKVNIERADTRTLPSLVGQLAKKYFDLYVQRGFNVEIGLTGSKLEAVASAILAAQRKVSEVWYLKPSKFDSNRFSSGFKEMSFFKIKIDK